jgi:hypothetical protein
MEDNEFGPSYGWLHSDLLMYLSLDSDLLIYQFSYEGFSKKGVTCYYSVV